MKIPSYTILAQSIGTISLLLVCLQSSQARSLDELARIDIHGGSAKSPVGFEVSDVSFGRTPRVTEGESGVKSCIISLPATASWQQGSMVILPSQSGYISVALLGPYIRVNPETKELRPVFVEYDDVQSDVAVIKNGGFEQASSDGSLAAWSVGDIRSSNPAIDDTNRGRVVAGEAPEGERFLRVWHSSRFYQAIYVEEGVPMTLTFMYRLGQ